VLGKNVPAVYIPKQQNYVESLMADTTLMNQVLGIKPRTMEEGITRFVEYIKGS
jgi:nucleoside-diphosphate-sugar epimerase